ncbi:MAG: hypothetical protein NUV92_00340 [Ignavibacteria bacterium]|jgi:hypothetical protein|nr:hypothetical protein [Ignavibacteria bacterium]MDH7528702.1 hypothetical protein [Ignavibacteria bacterium]
MFTVRNTISTLLILFYFILINGELVSLAEYYIRYDYIVKNLCVQRNKLKNTCKGSCHLKENLDKVDENSKEIPKSIEFRNLISVDTHLNTVNHNYDYSLYVISFLILNKLDYKQQTDIDVLTPPPKFFKYLKSEIRTRGIIKIKKILEENYEKNNNYFSYYYD